MADASWSRIIGDLASLDPVVTSKDLILLSLDAAKICWASLDHVNGVPMKLWGVRVRMVVSLSPVWLSKMWMAMVPGYLPTLLSAALAM